MGGWLFMLFFFFRKAGRMPHPLLDGPLYGSRPETRLGAPAAESSACGRAGELRLLGQVYCLMSDEPEKRILSKIWILQQRAYFFENDSYYLLLKD